MSRRAGRSSRRSPAWSSHSAPPTAAPSNTSPAVPSAGRRWCATRARRSTTAPTRADAAPRSSGASSTSSAARPSISRGSERRPSSCSTTTGSCAPSPISTTCRPRSWPPCLGWARNRPRTSSARSNGRSRCRFRACSSGWGSASSAKRRQSISPTTSGRWTP